MRRGERDGERKGGTEDPVSTRAVVIRVMSNGESSRAVLCCAPVRPQHPSQHHTFKRLGRGEGWRGTYWGHI